MSLVLLPPDLVEAIHDSVLNQGELQGRARDKSLEGTLAPIDHRLAYGMIEDAFDLAAAYAVAIATGHCFNDGNKRTAHQCMDVCLDMNGIEIAWDTVAVGDTIIAAAQGQIDAQDLADWLRVRAGD
ncbi:type II toxin-antitoxin system death-on-curing family toxin [Alterinioella nitratireducens]|uniref:type II toxin-antitoxin system death-on-curing family toxin n=1 Tax=Alterinioella nitratireducens TaxID=2735915 RepID=UPI001554CE1D|nr:type II toxin-antitoxin system death-on-curing family toxin [Alterinioella nitratireducens]NPD20585.1 type II toxin-antitoxin system death-on-curing family toxin [Alterinioella nitratireducens]